MKFSHSLKFNSVPEWREYYINYAAFKKIIYAIEQAERRLDSLDTLRRVSADGVAEPLLEAQPAPAEGESRFVKLLDAELTRIVSFYLHKESDLRARLEALKLQVRSVEAGRHERQASTASRESGRSSGMGASSSSEVARQVVWDSPALAGERQQWSAEVKSLYVEANDLAAYIDMNYDGFRKVLKKHDKVTGFSLKQRFMETVNDMFTFRDKAIVNSIIARSLDMYAAIACAGDTRRAKTDLQGHLRDHAKWERETVWRDMVGLERQRTTARVVREGAKQQLPAGTMQLLSVAVSLLAFLGLLSTPTFAEPEKRNCLALLVLVSLLWCTEALPLYTTAILVPALVVILRVLTGTSPQHPQQHRLTPGEAAKAIFAAMMSQASSDAGCGRADAVLTPLWAIGRAAMLIHMLAGVATAMQPGSVLRCLRPHRLRTDIATCLAMKPVVIMLLLGGFAIAAALTKHFIAKQVAMSVLSRCGRKPRNVLLGCMAVATLASMWISNVAAPVLCFSLVQPILRTLPSNSPFCRSLVMAIALASNIGGMTSPISSPQNIFAIERMSMAGEPPNWLRWFAVALPVATAGLMLCWGLLLLVYQPGRAVAEIRPLRPSDDAFNATQLWVCLVSVVTVALWCANSVLEHITGSMGVLAVLPMVLFFGTGVLNKDDFNGFLWNVVVLAMGGCALGEAVTSSGLLKAIAEGIQGIVGGWGLFSVLAVFCAVVCVLTSFISHTVGAMVILPIVQEVGKQLPGGSHANLLVFGAALMCSGAMALPVSGFPNMTAVSLEDPTGKTYVSTVDFLKLGVPGSIGTYVIILTLGYALMLLCGF